MERSASIRGWPGQMAPRHGSFSHEVSIAEPRARSLREAFAARSLLAILAEREYRPFTTPLGVGADGAPVVLRLDDPEVGNVVVGGDAAEQAEGLRTIAAGLALTARPALLQLCAIDLGGNGLRFLEALPHCLMETAADIPSAEALLRWLAADVQARRQERRRWPTIVLAILEADLVGDQLGRPGQRHLALIRREGSGLGVHLIAGSRRDGWIPGDTGNLVVVETRRAAPHWVVRQGRATARFLPARTLGARPGPDRERESRGQARVQSGGGPCPVSRVRASGMPGSGEAVHLWQPEGSWPREIVWRGRRFRVRTVEASDRNRNRSVGGGVRLSLRTDEGLRFHLRQDAAGAWRVDRLGSTGDGR